MTCYADDRAYKHLMDNEMRSSDSSAKSGAIPLLTFNGVNSIVDFVNKAVIDELIQSESIAGNVFLT